MGDCTCPHTDGFRIRNRSCPCHHEQDAPYMETAEHPAEAPAQDVADVLAASLNIVPPLRHIFRSQPLIVGEVLGALEVLLAQEIEHAAAALAPLLAAARAEGRAEVEAKVAVLADEWAYEGITCRCGHYPSSDHNSNGCYAVITYSPLVRCDCSLTDAQGDDDIAAARLRNLTSDPSALADRERAAAEKERERVARCIRNEAHGRNNAEWNRALLFAAGCALAKYDRHDAHSFCLDPATCPRCSTLGGDDRG